MSIDLKPNTVNQVVKGTTMFTHDETVGYICLILKGRVMVKSKGVITLLTPGCFIGINDLFIGRYLSDYVAADELALYVFSAEGTKTVENILATNKDYGGLMVYSLCNYLNNLVGIKETMKKQAKSVYEFIKLQYERYGKIGKEEGMSTITMPQVENLQEYEESYNVDEAKQRYYLECARIPLDAQKSYFSYSKVPAIYHSEEIASLIAENTLECAELSDYIEEAVYILMNDGEQSLFKNEALLAIRLRQVSKVNQDLMTLIDETIDEINGVENLFQEKVGRRLAINRKKMEQLYYVLLSGGDGTTEEEAETEDMITKLSELNGSLIQILKFSTWEDEEKKEFSTNIEKFLHASDRLSTDDDMRNLKRNIAKNYYLLYENVFLLAHGKKSIPAAIELFLNFGFVDERLLTKEQLSFLCSSVRQAPSENCSVYTIREWLTLVYEGKKEPSKTEFDLEYTDYLRTQKKHGEITEEQLKELNNNLLEKLRFEIKNMFAYNNRVVNGQLSTYVPILYEDMFLSSAERAFLSKQRVEDAFFRVRSIDYSAFCREVLYYDKEKKIEKEYIVRDILPDIILMPTVGVNGSMWQEISGKRRDTPGRFLFPVFMESNFEDVMVKMFGRFRWELCRFIQGTAWNNIQEKSLTSEYMDYIQFYRKNSDLSEERKEKLKLQIQKVRNNSREVFVLDYEAWIKGEAKGAIKLNKYVRGLLATYCPFSKEIRERIRLQPIFEEAMARFYRNTAKKVHELELRYHALSKDEIELTPELIETMRFYKEM